MPKIELHVHLDGSVRIETVSELTGRSINELRYEMIAKEKCDDLNDYLTKFKAPVEVMQSKNNLSRIAYELAVDLKNDGVIYAEIRFAPNKHLIENLSPNDVIDSVLAGLSRVDLKTNLILCMMREDSTIENMRIIDLARLYLNKGVCAIDLAGAESIYETDTFKELFEYAKEKQIPFTIHAGEAAGKESIKAAVEFGALRLGHGVRITEDEELINEVINKEILLEICPTSNIQTRVIDDYKNHPIKKLLDLGVQISINTDNRTVSRTSLTKEYIHLIKNLDFTDEDIIKTNKMAISHAFISDIEKKDLLNKFNSLL